jgi:lipopolysaccharide transport system ATP-binding protein
MSDPIIRAEGLSKQYILGVSRQRQSSLRDLLRYGLKERLQRSQQNRKGSSFWALKDVSFRVEEGEVLGVVGRNGAGKSTLLKILSRISEPTSGRVELRGRVGSLLEVGTGFHPELTGRENVFLNGAILGMKKAEIERKFDEIVAFSEVERFIDTPVKRYSSGMYVRLAFAVAAHLEPEILIVDEVLAVGDMSFQKKCLGKMHDVAGNGRTVLFVSHNVHAIRSLCTRAILLESGRVTAEGEPADVLHSYMGEQNVDLTSLAVKEFPDDPAREFQLRTVRLLDADNRPTHAFNCDEPMVLELTSEVRQTVPNLYGYLMISRPDGTYVWESDSTDRGDNPYDRLEPGLHRHRIVIPPRTLGPGIYGLHLSFATPTDDFRFDLPGDLFHIELSDLRSRRGNNRHGFFSTLLSWDRVPEFEPDYQEL